MLSIDNGKKDAVTKYLDSGQANRPRNEAEASGARGCVVVSGRVVVSGWHPIDVCCWRLFAGQGSQREEGVDGCLVQESESWMESRTETGSVTGILDGT